MDTEDEVVLRGMMRERRASLELLTGHSLANITEVFRQQSSIGTGRRGSTLDTFKILPGHGLESGIKNRDLERVQAAVVSLFQRKRLQENELGTLQQCVRPHPMVLIGTRQLVSLRHHKDKLLKKGMVILRETIKHDIEVFKRPAVWGLKDKKHLHKDFVAQQWKEIAEELAVAGRILLQKVSEQWNYFFKTVLPYLLAIFYPLKVDMPIRVITLMAFRDIVIYKVAFEESISVPNIQIPPSVVQMLLILQNLRENYQSTESTLKMEQMVAKVVNPYLGRRGLYRGSGEPVVKTESGTSSTPTIVISKTDCEFEKFSSHQLLDSRHHLGRHSSGFIMHSTLEPVVEMLDSTKKTSEIS